MGGILKIYLAGLLFALLAACAGGGGGSVAGGGSSFNETLVTGSPHALIKSADAYARGATGAGIKIGVIDSGLESSSQIDDAEFSNRVASGQYDYVFNDSRANDGNGHGTHVAGIIVASKDGSGMHGVAYGAQVIPLRICNSAGACVATDAQKGTAQTRGRSYGASLFNNSWGITTSITTSYVTASYIESNYPNELSGYQASDAADVINVWAAHNQARSQPSIQAGLPYLFPALQDTWVAVMAVDLDGAEPFYTNRCGVAAAWCIAAPGGGDDGQTEGIYSTWNKDETSVGHCVDVSYCRISGTSMAAPVVSGAIAVLMDLFPSLTPQKILTRMFTTATDGGIYADSTIFGHGLLNLSSASGPIGSLSIAEGASIYGPGYDITQSKIDLGAAFGDGLRTSLGDQALAVFDGFDGATFYVNAGSFVLPKALAPSAQDRLSWFGRSNVTETHTIAGGEITQSFAASPNPDGTQEIDSVRLSFETRHDLGVELSLGSKPSEEFGLHGQAMVGSDMLAGPDALEVPYLSFLDGGLGAVVKSSGGSRFGGYLTQSGPEGLNALGAVLEMNGQFGERLGAALLLGLLQEKDTILGSATQGAFASDQNTLTNFMGMSWKYSMDSRTEVIGSYHLGFSYPSPANGSIFTSFSKIKTRAASLAIATLDVFSEGDRLGFIASQPIRVEQGTATLSMTTGRDLAGNVSRTPLTAKLEPTGREQDFEAFYRMPLGAQTSLNTSALLRLDPGHSAHTERDAVFLLRLQTAL